MKKKILLILSIFCLNCSSVDYSTEFIENISILIAEGNLSGNGSEGITQQNLIISSETAWNDLITQMNSTYDFTNIDINFSEYRVIAAFDEIRPSGGYFLELDITFNSENIVVNVIKNVPPNDVYTPAVITQPFHIVKISNTDLPVIFES